MYVNVLKQKMNKFMWFLKECTGGTGLEYGHPCCARVTGHILEL